MKYNSSLLKDPTSNKSNSLMLENSVKENQNEFSFLYDLLEFNDIMHQIDADEKINYYRSLVEFENNHNELVLQEGIVSSVHDFISKAIQAIIDLFNKFINFIRGRSNSETAKKGKTAEAEFDASKKSTSSSGSSHSSSSASSSTTGSGSPKNDDNVSKGSPLDQTKELTIFINPSPNDIPERYISPSLNNLFGVLERLLDGEDVNTENIDDYYKMAYKVMSKCIVRKRNTYNGSVTDSKSFRDCVNADSCFTESKQMRVVDYLNQYRPSSRNTDNSSRIAQSKLASIRNEVKKWGDNLNTRQAAITPESRAAANKIMTYANNVCNDIIWYFNLIMTSDTKAISYYNKLWNSAKSGKVNESGFIHGEPFNGDTLFDNDDIRDFNRTEWLDLQLATECYEINSAVYEYRRRVAVNEAMILLEDIDSSDKLAKLIAMQEAESKRLGDQFMQMLQTVISAVDKFFATIGDKLSLDANFIKKNRDIIENKSITITNIQSTGDILNGLTRVQTKLDLTPYNYETMKDKLGDERAFFNAFIRSKLAGNLRNGANWDDSNMTVAELCKAYYGASLPEDKCVKVNIGTKEVQSNIKNIISFLEAPNSMMANIRAELNTLKTQAKKAADEANKDTNNNTPAQITQQSSAASTNTNSGQQDNKNSTGAKQESYYSELFGRVLTEVDMNVPKSDTTNNGTASGSEQVSTTAKKDSKSGFSSYIQAYRSVLLAKLTGAQFVRSELMALIKAHVNVYNPKANQNDNKPAENQNQGQNTNNKK